MYVNNAICLDAAGPKDNWAENKPGTADSPTNSSKPKRLKKSKKLAANLKQKADNDQKDKDYIGTAQHYLTTPAKAKRVPTR